jgi:copper chaperone CopZ
MNRKRLTTALLLLTSVAMLVALAFRVSIGATADSVAVLRTTGMTCGSCASKISDALKKVEGVAATEVDVENGWVIVGYDTKTAQPEKLAAKVKETGYFSMVSEVITPERFKQLTGRDIGQKVAPSGGCGGCGGGKSGGCGSNKQG